MIELFKRLFYVSLNARGPDSLPGSQGMLALCLIPWVVVTVFGNLIQLPEQTGLAMMGVAFELLLMFGFVRLVLRFAGKMERWPQTIVSLFGVQALITALSFPAIYLATRQDEAGLFLQAVNIAFLAWWLVAKANILAKAVDLGLGMGALLSLGHYVLVLMVYAMLFTVFGVTPDGS